MCKTAPSSRSCPDLSVVRGADDPLQRLQPHVQSAQRRVLMLAESDGRPRKPAGLLALLTAEPAGL